MPLPQILRSRSQFAVSLLRQSIRIHTPTGAIRPRCFVTTLPRTQEIETPATSEISSEESTQNKETPAAGETSSEESTQNKNTQPFYIPNPPPPTLRIVPGLTIRKVTATRHFPGTNIKISVRKTPVQTFRMKMSDRGYSIVRITKLIEALRDPTVLPTGALILHKISLRPNQINLKDERIVIVIHDIAMERRFLKESPNSAQSPIMAKLAITDIERDSSRYVVKNLRDVGLGSVNPLDPTKEPIISHWRKAEFFANRQFTENVEAILKTPKGSNVIFEWEAGEFQSIPVAKAVEKLLGQYRYLQLVVKRIAGFIHPDETTKLLSWEPELYRSLLRFIKKTERHADIILKTPRDAKVVFSIRGQVREVPVVDAVERMSEDLGYVIEKLETIIECCNGVGVDKEILQLRRMRRFESRINKNIESILSAPIEQEFITVTTMDGKSDVVRSDAIRVVFDQVSRNIEVIAKLLSDMGYPLVDGTLKNNIPFKRRTFIHRVRPLAPTIRRFFVPEMRTIPSSTREYNTNASRTYQGNREKGGSQGAWRKESQRRLSPFELISSSLPGSPSMSRPPFKPPLSGPRPQQGGSAFRSIFKNKTETTKPIRPTPAPGDSVRDKMAEKEKDRSEAMEGLAYALLTKDYQPGGGASVQKVVEKDTFQNVGAWEGGEMGGLTDESGVEPLRKGDMCEIRIGGTSQLGIFLRPSLFGEPTSDFLMMSGEINMKQTPRITFAIPSFIPEEFITALTNQYDKILQRSGLGREGRSQIVLPRTMMSSILEKVRAFSDESAKLYAVKRAKFDELYERLAFENESTTITLFEAAEEIFGTSYGGQELYATHLALMGDGTKYMADRAVHRATSTFTVRSKADVTMIESVTRYVRKSINKDDSSKKRQSTGGEQLNSFIAKAQILIDRSRKNKEENLKNKGLSVKRVDVEDVVWEESDKFFIDYVKASVMKSGSQTTPMEGLVPSILRATERYTGVLDGVTGYQFMTEIGAWSPWENLALRQNNITFPGYGTSKLADEDEERFVKADTLEAVEKMDLKDCMKDIRKDWGDLEVYCIDDASAHEIDDGVSLERVSDTENWVHVHIANPTAFLPQNHWLSDVAFRRKQSLYLPERVYPMLPVSLTEVLGMGPNRGVITISAKVSKEGEILDYNVQAGFVRNVKRFTYNAIAEALGQPHKQLATYEFGKLPERAREPPKANFTEKQLADFKTLSEIAVACRTRRVRDGLVECSTPSYDVSIYDGLDSPIHPLDSPQPFLYRGHPSVRLTVDHEQQRGVSQFLIAEMMQLANNVTARFCKKNNIAAPFRVMEYDYERSDLVKHFIDEILPARDEFGRLNFELGLRYMMFVGQTRLNVSSKPHRLLGFEDGYVRATSPLRRYSDMIAHWQIQAHLLGKSPRTHKQLSSLIPEMDRGERLAQFTNKDSKRFWGTVGIGRMMESDESGLPESMEFMVMEKQKHPTLSVGFVLELGMAGKVGFSSKAEEMSVNIGDIIRVKPDNAKPGEKFVWYGFQGMVRKAQKIMGME